MMGLFMLGALLWVLFGSKSGSSPFSSDNRVANAYEAANEAERKRLKAEVAKSLASSTAPKSSSTTKAKR